MGHIMGACFVGLSANLTTSCYKTATTGLHGIHRHSGSGLDGRPWLDRLQVMQEATDAGLRLQAFSDPRYMADDEVRRRSVKGSSDRLTLLFEKPR
jgi:hypothetical protein